MITESDAIVFIIILAAIHSISAVCRKWWAQFIIITCLIAITTLVLCNKFNSEVITVEIFYVVCIMLYNVLYVSHGDKMIDGFLWPRIRNYLIRSLQ